MLNCKVTQLPQSCSILVTLMFTTSLSPQFGGTGPPPTPALTQLTPSAPSSGSCYVPAFSSHTVTVTESHPLSPAPSSLHPSAPGFRILYLVPLRCLSSALCAQTSLGEEGVACSLYACTPTVTETSIPTPPRQSSPGTYTGSVARGGRLRRACLTEGRQRLV